MQSLGERQLLMGETPKTALAPQDRANHASGGFSVKLHNHRLYIEARQGTSVKMRLAVGHATGCS
ncbi:hypothetical protein [Moorena sp. SIO3H5]|uniref:hypothetical protein n=1 Tax=Moorena sp. SIO3H5 TaxID=2607834 RepID=UPI0013BC22E8|nr:hypothetical protein [Moorena sp. SIO3H5]NEO69240.1 hypothetical protein [Moorena sp. SIO3H5]